MWPFLYYFDFIIAKTNKENSLIKFAGNFSADIRKSVFYNGVTVPLLAVRPPTGKGG